MDVFGVSIKYYKMRSRSSKSSAAKCVCNVSSLALDEAEAQHLCSASELLVHNAYFMAWGSCKADSMTIWCLASNGCVLKTVDDMQPFKLCVNLNRGSAHQVSRHLKQVDNVAIQQFNGGGPEEPVAVTALRNAVSKNVPPFRSRDECISEYWDAMNDNLGTSVEEYIKGMQCSQLAASIFHVQFDHQLLMASTMLRLQERYECPCAELRGRCFSLAEYKAWERKKYPVHGFTYYERWPGFNVPGTVVRAALQSSVLLPREEALKRVLGDAFSLDNFYVIGTATKDESATLYHEVCHALYEVRPNYRADVDRYLATIDECMMIRLKGWLRCDGYADVDRILQDEIHAYLSEGSAMGCKISKTAPHTKQLRHIFSTHADDFADLLPTDDEWSESGSESEYD